MGSSMGAQVVDSGLLKRFLIHRGRSVAWGLLSLSLTGCGPDGEQIREISTASTGAIVRLAWDDVNDPSVVGYYIHYGKQASNQPGSCAYDQATFVLAPEGTVTGLELGHTYYFAVSAYNGAESSCSNEVQTQP
jgi:hypothetical protein